MISPDAMKALCCDDATSDDKSLCLRRRRCLVIDCRPFIAFNSGHIVSALNVHCPPILKRRTGGKIQLQNVISSDEVRSEVMNSQYDVAVFYDDRTMDIDQLPPDSVIIMAIKVVQETQRMPEIYLLQGNYFSNTKRYTRPVRNGFLFRERFLQFLNYVICLSFQ